MFLWPHRLTVRTRPFQGCNRSSILRGVTATKKSALQRSFSCAVKPQLCRVATARRGREHFTEFEQSEELCLVIRDHIDRRAALHL